MVKLLAWYDNEWGSSARVVSEREKRGRAGRARADRSRGPYPPPHPQLDLVAHIALVGAKVNA